MKTVKQKKVIFNLQTNEIRYKGITEKCLDNWVLVDIKNESWERQGWKMDNIIFNHVYEVKEYFQNKIDKLKK